MLQTVKTVENGVISRDDARRERKGNVCKKRFGKG